MTYAQQALTWVLLGAAVGLAVRPFIVRPARGTRPPLDHWRSR